MEGKFIPATRSYDQVTYDGIRVSRGMKLYQISKSPDEKILILIEYEVKDIGPDGRIVVEGRTKYENTEHILKNQTAANAFYSSPASLIKDRLAQIKYSMEIELPKQYNQVAKLALENNIDLSTLAVGDMNEEQEI